MLPHHLNILPFNVVKDLVSLSIFGQDELIETIAITLYRHLLKIAGVNSGQLKNYATNLLIIGKTGTGKTFTVKEIAKAIKLPFIEIDASDLSLGGSYKGESLKDVLTSKFKKIENEESRNYPIILIDEFDKMCKPDSISHNAAVQASILKIIDGIVLNIRDVEYDTRNFCFIFAGAFTDLFKENRPNIGFTEETIVDDERIITTELENFGIIPELSGRINKVVKANDFTTEMYYKLVCNPSAPVNTWIDYLKKLGAKHVKELNVVALVAAAEKRQLGGRGLNQLLDKELDTILLNNIEHIDINKAWDRQFPGYIKVNKDLDELG